MTSRSTASRFWRLLALLVGLSLIAAACGGDDGDSNTDDTSGSDTTDVTEPDESDVGDPVPGGKLVYGLEADTATPWTPAKSVCAISCHMVMRSVYDTLTLFAEDGTPKPNLLESFAPNDDFTQWTLVPRSGITFHDGTPFDAAAIKTNLDAHRASFLTGSALAQVSDVSVSEDGKSVVVTMLAPWARFPVFLTGQIGYMASPTWLAATVDDPSLEAKPVGTGPFVFKSYEAGGSFIATKNADYWREGLPYLDEIEYRVLADVQSRKNALLAGEINIMHTSNGDTIKSLRDEDSIELTETSAYGETGYTLLQVANAESPVNDLRIRKAMAMAIDNELLIERRGGGIGEVANGPFSPDQTGYLADTGYPEFDVEGAKALVDEYKTDKGVDEVKISYTTTTDPFNLGTAELLKSLWEAVGLKVELAQIEQGQFILTALSGQFEAFGWRNHGGVDPDSQRVWWHSETSDPEGKMGIALNFGRIRDDVIDENLNIIRGSDDPAAVKSAAEAINRRFGEQVYNLWSSWVVWGIAKDPAVNGLDTFTLPDGDSEIYGNGIGGSHQVSQLWISE